MILPLFFPILEIVILIDDVYDDDDNKINYMKNPESVFRFRVG